MVRSVPEWFRTKTKSLYQIKKQSLFYIQTRTLAKIAANGSGIFCIGEGGGDGRQFDNKDCTNKQT